MLTWVAKCTLVGVKISGQPAWVKSVWETVGLEELKSMALVRVSRTEWNKELKKVKSIMTNVMHCHFHCISDCLWGTALTTLFVPEPPRSSPASSCRPEAGPELAAPGTEMATPETARRVERHFSAIKVADEQMCDDRNKLLKVISHTGSGIWIICSLRKS